MKKLITCFMLLTVFALSAQQSYWTSYSFIVEPENEDTVVKLIDDYFKEHKIDGVSVSLYANHFYDDDNTTTHMVVFSGSLDAVGAMYAADNGDAWALLGARLDHFIKDSSGARMGTTKIAYGDTDGTYPIQQYYILDVEDAKTMQEELTKFNNKYKPEGRVVMMGNFTSGISPEGENHWVIAGYKDMKSALGGNSVGLSDKEKAARDADWKTFQDNNGGVKMIRSGLRIRVGQW